MVSCITMPLYEACKYLYGKAVAVPLKTTKSMKVETAYASLLTMNNCS